MFDIPGSQLGGWFDPDTNTYEATTDWELVV